jgi:hypothetical protein
MIASSELRTESCDEVDSGIVSKQKMEFKYIAEHNMSQIAPNGIPEAHRLLQRNRNLEQRDN